MLVLSPNPAAQNTEFLDLYAVALMESGDVQQAEGILEKLVDLAPDEGHEKYLYLGQLRQGEAAVTAYQKGIQLLQQQLDDAIHQQSVYIILRWKLSIEKLSLNDAGIPQKQLPDEDAPTVDDWQRALMSALCALAEHHLAVHAEGVEAIASEVETLAHRAASTAPGAAEPMQVLATLRHLQGRPDEALQLLKDSIATWCAQDPATHAQSVQ